MIGRGERYMRRCAYLAGRWVVRTRLFRKTSILNSSVEGISYFGIRYSERAFVRDHNMHTYYEHRFY